ATVLEALSILKALDWHKCDPHDPRTTQRRVEALRIAWDDRLRLLGDQCEDSAQHLLSADYARRAAERVEEAVRNARPVAAATDAAYLRRLGYRVTRGPGAVADGVTRDPRTGAISARGR